MFLFLENKYVQIVVLKKNKMKKLKKFKNII